MNSALYRRVRVQGKGHLSNIFDELEMLRKWHGVPKSMTGSTQRVSCAFLWPVFFASVSSSLSSLCICPQISLLILSLALSLPGSLSFSLSPSLPLSHLSPDTLSGSLSFPSLSLSLSLPLSLSLILSLSLSLLSLLSFSLYPFLSLTFPASFSFFLSFQFFSFLVFISFAHSPALLSPALSLSSSLCPFTSPSPSVPLPLSHPGGDHISAGPVT